MLFSRTLPHLHSWPDSSHRYCTRQAWRLLPKHSGRIPFQKYHRSGLPAVALLTKSYGPRVALHLQHSSSRGHQHNPKFPRQLYLCKPLQVRQGRAKSDFRTFSLPDHIDATLRNIISISAVLGISYAVLLASVAEPRKPPPLPPGSSPGSDRRALGPGAPVSPPPEDDNFVWGLMGFISILPLFNWMAWVLAAINDEDRAALYGLYAALYGSPLLLRGLDWQDSWVVFMLVLCVAHVQAERIAQTEPEMLRSLRPVGAVGGAVRGLLQGAGGLLAGLGGVLAEDSRRAVRRTSDRNDGRSDGTQGPPQSPPALGSGDDRLQLGEDPELRRDPRRDPVRDVNVGDFEAAEELRQFDEELRRAEQDRRKRGGGRS